jgi:carboxymethylenebutenolidase
MPSIRQEWISLQAGDGTALRAWAARPEGEAPRLGLLVMQEIFGVNAHMRSITERWAAEGFLALCPELYHRHASGYDAPYDQLGSAREEAARLTPEGLKADLEACADWLRQEGAERVACIGYCMGGRMAYMANALLPLDRAVSCYGGMIHQQLERVKDLSGPHLFLWGGLDTAITWEQRPLVEQTLQASGKPYRSLVFGEAKHGFFCDARPEHFHAGCAAEGWRIAADFLRDGR